MITFSPIHRNVQETLFKKMDMLDKNINSYSIGTTRATEDGNTNENYMYARSVFLRMTSLLTYNKKPVIIMGGEMREGKFKSGYDDLYGKRSTTDENKMRRPIAGIKDVNVEYKGGGMKIGATRTTSVSWTCWTWEELQRFKPFFLKHGRTVLVEFGWSFSGIDKPRMLDIIDDKGELRDDLLLDGNGRALNERLPEHILQQKGHYDAVLGLIQNFEFTVNESGGFDCTTDIISLGVNTLQKMDSKENMMGAIDGLPIKDPLKTGMWWWQEDDFLGQIEDKNPYYNFVSYMKSFQGQLHKNAANSLGAIAYLDLDRSPYCTWGWFEDNVLSRFISIVNEKSEVVTEFRSIENIYNPSGKLITTQPVKIRNSKDLLVVDFNKWFFVDNPEGILLQGIKKEGSSEATRKFDYKLKYGPNFSHAGSVDTSPYKENWEKHFGETPEKTDGDGRSFRIFPSRTDSEVLQNSDTGHSFSGETEVIVIEETGERIEIPSLLSNAERKQLMEGREGEVAPIDARQGVLRNVYFGWKFLMDSFVDASTIKDGILKVWDTFSAEYGGIYDFQIHFDDKEGRLLIKDAGFSEKRVKEVLENKSTNGSYSLGNPGVFVFPIWEKTSMVKSQNLSAKLPSRMQVAAMYGSNKADMFSDGVVDNYDDWGGVALGKAEKESEKETLHIFEKDEQQELYDSLIGTMEHPFKRGEKGKNGAPGQDYTFGNASADVTKKLQWKEGGGTNTTGIYEDSGEGGEDLFQVDKHQYLGINEVLNEQLKEEFQNRVKDAMGVGDTSGIAEATGLTEAQVNDLTADTLKTMEATWRIKDDANATKHLLTIYGGNKKNHKFKDSGPLGAKLKMKAEYVGIMRMALKGGKGGMLKQSDPLVPIELELEVDGIGGIFPGNSFHSSYLPQSYQDRICFQVKGASQKVDASGWTTTLQGQMRVAGYSAPTGSELKPKAPTVVVESESLSTSKPAGSYEMPLGGGDGIDLNKDGKPDTITINTVAVDNTAAAIANSTDPLVLSAPTSGLQTTDEYNKQLAELAGNIEVTDEYWELNHLLDAAKDVDAKRIAEGGTATGAGFLTWFYNKGDITAEKGWDWYGDDTDYLEKAANLYEIEQINFSIPTNQTLDFTNLQSGN